MEKIKDLRNFINKFDDDYYFTFEANIYDSLRIYGSTLKAGHLSEISFVNDTINMVLTYDHDNESFIYKNDFLQYIEQFDDTMKIEFSFFIERYKQPKITFDNHRIDNKNIILTFSE